MKKSMLALAITALASTAWAQMAPTVTSPAVATTITSKTVTTTQALPPLPTGANPFTGVTKAQAEIERSEDELKRLRALSTQKLSLQRDELEALRIELDKKKILDALNPPKVVEIKVPSSVSGSGSTSTTTTTSTTVVKKPVVIKQPVVVKIEKPAPTPPQIIAPAATKYETPQVLGVIDVYGQKVAMVRFDGQMLRVASGSTVGGKPIANIEPNGMQWGTSFLTVGSTDSGPPTVIVTDDRSDAKNRNVQPMAAPPVQMQQPVTVQPSYGPTSPVTFSPQGATRSTNGASGPTGVLQLPPPPPTFAR